MSIKQSIAALLVLMSVSFNASAIWWEVSSSSSEECVMPGTAFTNWDDVVALSSCFNGKTVYNKPGKAGLTLKPTKRLSNQP